MSTTNKDNTEEKILNAAKTVFVKKGMDGTRMQEIADTAGINKALLHYYFRTKQKLYEAIFKQVFKQIFPGLESLLESNLPIEQRIEMFIESYFTVLLNNPFLPSFIIREINRDPDFLASVMKNQGINPNQIFDVFQKEMDAGHIRKMDPRDLMVNILGMCIFPFVAKPLLKILLYNNDKKQYNEFLHRRKESVKQFILNSIML